MKVFLGGTVADTKWRNEIIEKLKIEYFNPVVENWNEVAYQQELDERKNAHFCLYVISPRMEGYYSLAEVVDDSFKKSDKTIYCFLREDAGKAFTDKQIGDLEKLGKLVQANGAIWKHSLNEVVDFLNSANELANDALLQQTDQINNAFVSYGRRHSLAFARLLYQSLTTRGYKVWFDMNDIPLGVDFQEQINDGIRRADNFIYIMSPHSINSDYCFKELLLALKYNKRIIPMLHVEPLDKPTWNNINPEIQRRNWIYLRQDHDTAVALSERALKIQNKILEIEKDEWKFTDKYTEAVDSLVALMDSHRAYVRTHTVLLDSALKWLTAKQSTNHLLVGKERMSAEEFLLRSHQVFRNPSGHLINPPCLPTNLIAEFVMESKKNGNNLQCDLFICHDSDDAVVVNNIRNGLMKYGFSSWISSVDIRKGEEYNHAIHNGVVQSSSMLFFLSSKSLKSEYCKKEYNFAIGYNKRIIPILIETNLVGNANSHEFKGLEQLQYINFIDYSDKINQEINDSLSTKADVEARNEKTPFDISLAELVNTLNDDRSYYEQHRVILMQALRWNERGMKPSFLLRGHNLENARTWLRLNESREQYLPLPLHRNFITASEAAKGQLSTEVFISYSRKDGDFARQLNEKLQIAGKTTWFDQESISKGVDFEKEIYNGIDGCDNFVFIISPDSVLSKYCEREVNYALEQHKRLITLLVRETASEIIPPSLKTINWIDFVKTEFSQSFADLLQEIELDREYANQHTKLLQRANEWTENKQSTDYLLNSSACIKAETWLVEAFKETDMKKIVAQEDVEPQKNPAPTPLQINFIAKSRQTLNESDRVERQRQEKMLVLEREQQMLVMQRKINKRQKISMVVLGFAVFFSVGFAIFGLWQKEIAKSREMETKIAFKDYYLTKADSHIKKEEYDLAISSYIFVRDSIFDEIEDEEKDWLDNKIDSCSALKQEYDAFMAVLNEADLLLKENEPESILRADSLLSLPQMTDYKAGDTRLTLRKTTTDKLKVVKAVEFHNLAEGFKKLGEAKTADEFLKTASKLEPELFVKESKEKMRKIIDKNKFKFRRDK